jgi:hypothetical protein
MPAQANSSQDFISKNPSQKIELVERLKFQALAMKKKKIADFSTEPVNARRAWSEVFQTLKENNFCPMILYPAKLSFRINGVIKVLHDKQKLKQYMTINHHYRKF